MTWERRNDLADPWDGEGHSHPAAASDGHTGFCVHHLERAEEIARHLPTVLSMEVFERTSAPGAAPR